MILRAILFLTLLIICYELLFRQRRSEKRHIQEIKKIKDEEIQEVRNKREWMKLLPFKMTQEELDKLGNPLPFKINLPGYYILKSALGAFFFIGLYARFNSISLGVLGIPLGFYFLDWIYKRNNIRDLDLIRLDLEEVYNSLRFSIRSGESIGVALANVYRSARRSERLRKALLSMAAKINMTADVESALDEFKNKFNFDETTLFANSLKQSLQTGLVENIINGQCVQVSRKNTEYRNSMIDKIDKELFILCGLVFLGGIALLFIVTIAEVGNSLNQIFI